MQLITLPSNGKIIGLNFFTRVTNIREEPIEGTVRMRRLPANPNYRGKASLCPVMRTTTCEFLEPSPDPGVVKPRVLTSATVTLNPAMDKHERKAAQRFALTKAMNYARGLGLVKTREDREAVWQAWWNRGKSNAQ